MAVQIQIRRGTASEWTSANPTLAEGELGLETDTSLIKIGDGDTAWNSLSYALISGTVGDGLITEQKLANNAVTNAKIANNAVSQGKLESTLSGITICTSTTRPGSPFSGQTIYETNTALLRVWNGSTWLTIGPTTVTPTFNTVQKITSTNASWAVPTLASPIVRLTVIGGGGGGAGGVGGGAGSAGGTTTFGVGQVWAVSAVGGAGGLAVNNNGTSGTAGFAAGNHGMAGGSNTTVDGEDGQAGLGGEVNIAYVNLTGISTVSVTVGAGGAGGTGTSFARAGGAGGRGEVIVEYAV